ncbi:MAG: hypothetical protein RR047_01365 [Bacilli bacterium]
MKNAKTIILSLVAVVAISLPVAAGGSKMLEDGKLRFAWDSGIQFNGKWATSTLQGDHHEKKATACVGVCSTSGWVDKLTYTAHVKDIGGYSDSATSLYDYR